MKPSAWLQNKTYSPAGRKAGEDICPLKKYSPLTEWASWGSESLRVCVLKVWRNTENLLQNRILFQLEALRINHTNTRQSRWRDEWRFLEKILKISQ